MMPNMKETTAGQHGIEAAMKAADFVHFNGSALCLLFDLIDEEAAFDALGGLYAQKQRLIIDAHLVKARLQTIVGILEGQSTARLDSIAVIRGIDADAMLRWYGAKLTDLMRAIRPEKCAAA